jgi:hypothetical protein
MAEGIPTCLSDAFKQAIVVCHDWSGDKREPPAVGIAWDPDQERDPQTQKRYVAPSVTSVTRCRARLSPCC